MTLSSVLWIVAGLFPISEIGLGIFRRARLSAATSHDRGSMAVIWFVIVVSMAAAMGTQRISAARMPFPRSTVHLVGLLVLLVGLTIRWMAIITLGRFFTVNVAVHQDHRIVQTGLYRVVRHPSYLGLLIAFLGLGIAFANWLSLLVLVVPIFVALGARIAIEERVLHEALGAEYGAYCRRTARLIPGLY
jgi:protein-S-isoprenylcysteine O-methyltransferase Ste14